jgi:adenylate cyclase class 1
VFLELLALIFHQNHPLLPGFISSNTPAGIPDFTPTKAMLKAAKLFTRSYRYKRRASKSYAIEGLFLMGSVSSIAFTKTSDIDIWLCHQPNLSQGAITKLQNKATAIEKWAASLNLEVHFFLINSEQFRTGKGTPISTESSGKTQHFLLLEEFYRTAIYIAGKFPVWWLVPPHEQQNYPSYVEHLLEKRFISRHEIIDFGGLNAVPVEEFVSATLWHIYKAIYSPYKSLLKLLLMESYASEFPQPKWLSTELKQIVYQGQFLFDDLDPYLLIYRKVEKYLQKTHATGRIDLVRKCLYLKVLGHSDKYSDPRTRHIQEAFIKNVARRWDWEESNLVELGRRDSWNINNALQEHNTIVRQLTQCHRMNIGFALNYLKANYQYDEDSRLIGRKLFSFLEKKPDKVEIISTRSTIQSIEKEISILEISFAEGRMGWGLFLGNKKTEHPDRHEAIKTSWSLIEILVWMVVNGLYHKKLKIQVRFDSLTLNTSDIQLALSQISQFLSHNLSIEDKSLKIYRQRKTQVASLVFINLGVLLPESRDNRLVMMSERSDALSYGIAKENFIRTIDCISISSWGEIFFSKHYEVEGLFTCFIENINKSMDAKKPALMTVACYTPLRSQSIILRIQNIYQMLLRSYTIEASKSRIRYILPSSQAYFMFQEINGALKFYKIDSSSQLLKELGKSQDAFCSVHFDPAVLETTAIPYLYTLNKSGAIQVFFIMATDAIDLYVIDEKGALFYQRHVKTTAKRLWTAYSVFLETVNNNHNFDYELVIEYYEVFSNSSGVFSYKRLKSETAMTQDFLPIRVTGIEIDQSQINYTIYCGGDEFTSINFGDQVFKKASEYVVQLRNNKEHYPVYITDIDVPWTILGFDSAKQFQTIRYLQYKQKIENRLNLYFS